MRVPVTNVLGVCACVQHVILLYNSITHCDTGELNKGFYYLMTELPQERLVIAGLAGATCDVSYIEYSSFLILFSVAASEGVFEITRKYVQERKAFGGISI